MKAKLGVTRNKIVLKNNADLVNFFVDGKVK